MRIFFWAPVALSMAVLCMALASPAGAAIMREWEDQGGARTFGGDEYNLPVRPTLRWQDAVAWARTMPTVQLAMQTCAARGYEPLGAHDTATISIDPPATAVIFPYQKPGFVLPDYHSGQPLLMVFTTIGNDGQPATRVTAGVVIVDALNNVAFTADSLPQYAESDASFDVVSEGGGEGGPGDRRPTIRPAWPQWFADQKSGFNKFVRCWGVGGISTCIRPLIQFMPAIWAAKGVVFFSWSIDDPSTGRLHGRGPRDRTGPPE